MKEKLNKMHEDHDEFVANIIEKYPYLSSKVKIVNRKRAKLTFEVMDSDLWLKNYHEYVYHMNCLLFDSLNTDIGSAHH